MITSLIYLTKNGGETFRESLRMVFSQEIDFRLEVIVVDSGSSDQTLQACTEYPVRLIRIPSTSFNHSSTRNLALSEAKGKYCVFIVQDAIPTDGKWLAMLVKPMLENEQIAGVFGRQISREDASPLSKSCKLLWYQEWKKDWRQACEQLPIQPDIWRNLSSQEKMQYARFDNVNSCIRKSVWEMIPFPDVPYAEDLAWASAVLTSGYSIFWQPQARVFHSHARSLAYEFRRSYVDMKNISSIVNDSQMKLTAAKARAVIGWLMDEARRFRAEIPAGQYEKTTIETGVIAEADSLWQWLNQRKDLLERQRGAAFLSLFPFGRNIEDILFQYFYRSLAGPEWFRKLCRRLPTWRRDSDGETPPVSNVSIPLFRLEVQGRHRLFLNQLLQIHFAQNRATRNSVRSIRLGAAIMVGGSLLGQQMSGRDCAGRSTGEGGILALRGQYAKDLGFWQLLDAWYNQKGCQEEDDLLELDLLLSGGV